MPFILRVNGILADTHDMYILSAALDGEVAKPFFGGNKRCALLDISTQDHIPFRLKKEYFPAQA